MSPLAPAPRPPVVFSMALTPALAEVGSRLAQMVESADDAATSDDDQAPLPVMEVGSNVLLGDHSIRFYVPSILASAEYLEQHMSDMSMLVSSALPQMSKSSTCCGSLLACVLVQLFRLRTLL